MQIHKIITTVGISALLAAPLLYASPATQQVAMIDSKVITQQDLDNFIEKNYADPAEQPQPRQALEEFIRLQLVMADAKRSGLESDPEYIAKKAELEEQLLIGLALARYIEQHPIDEETLLSTYKGLLPRLQSAEFKARHILVEDEARAKELIQQLNQGASFSELAIQHSTGPSGPNGGDLGWFNPKQMVPAFAEALTQLQKGQYSTTPTQTQFGWHIILMEDQRHSEAPPFVSLKPQLEKQAQQQQVSRYIEALHQAAKVSISLPNP